MYGRVQVFALPAGTGASKEGTQRALRGSWRVTPGSWRVTPGSCSWFVVPASGSRFPDQRVQGMCLTASGSRVPRPYHNSMAGVCGRRSASRLSSRGCNGCAACDVSVKTVYPSLGEMLSANCDSRTGATQMPSNDRSFERTSDRSSKPHRENSLVPERRTKGASTDSPSTRRQRGEP